MDLRINLSTEDINNIQALVDKEKSKWLRRKVKAKHDKLNFDVCESWQFHWQRIYDELEKIKDYIF